MFNENTKNMLKVRVRGGFSDRNGINSENTEMQYKEFDERTRISLVNIVNVIYNWIFEDSYDRKKQLFLKSILFHVYLQEVDYDDRVEYSDKKVFKIINDTLMNDEYDSVLTLIEFICQEFCKYSQNDLSEDFNFIFKSEYVGYRFVDGQIVPITDENEIGTIKDASNSKYKQVNIHLKKSVSLLSDRTSPDYENSIKESISAVEAICVEILGKGATLGAALKQLEKNGVTIHPSMKSAFEKLYGYTSDANGLRHAGNIGGPSSTFDEAKFMLVSCSAFINYLIGISAP